MSSRSERQFQRSVQLLRLLRRVEGHMHLNPDEKRLKDSLEACPNITQALAAKRMKWNWKPAEIRKIDHFISTRARIGNGKPFRRNDEVRTLAASIGRSEESVYKMIQRRRKQSQCPSADHRAEG